MALIDNLISYWKLDETSGDAVDAHGSNTLTEHGTGGVGAATGIINGARDFEETENDYFSHADNSDLSTGDIDFTFQAWIKFESKTNARGILGKWVSGQYEYIIYYNVGSDRLQWFVSSNGSATTSVTANNLGSPSIGTWYLIHAWHDSVNNEIGIAVNAGTADTLSYSSGVNDGTAEFNLGRNQDGPDFFDGLIDEVGFWKRVLTSGERTSLYNGGAGFGYPFVSGGGVSNIRRS